MENIDWQVRLVIEHRELYKRIESLKDYIDKNDIDAVDILRYQLHTMELYKNILEQRLINVGYDIDELTRNL